VELKQLQYFVRVAEAGGFSQAGAQINLTQSTLSRQIGLLERELSHRLLVRTGRGVAITEAGATLLRNARAMLALAAQTRDELAELQSNPAGRITIGLPPRVAHALAAPLVEQFRAAFPQAVITVSEGLSYHLRELLVAGRLDLALLFDPPPSPQLTLETLSTEALLLVAPRRHAKQLPGRVSLRALADYPLVLPSSPNATRLLIDSVVKPRQIALNVIAEVDSIRGMVSLIARGVACSILPQSSVSTDIPRHGFQLASIGPPAIRSRLALASAKAGATTRLVRGTADLLRGLNYSELAGDPI
jgi:LysR family nitrogen assimilation transcriptional regulator